MKVIGYIDEGWSPKQTFKDAVRAQIKKEDMGGWLKRQEEEWKIVPPLPLTKIKNRGLLKILITQFLP